MKMFSRLCAGGRARWKIENETFNTLKNQGYGFGHNYGLGKNNLSTVFVLLMMLAFLVDQALQLCCVLFNEVWIKVKSKRQLWDDIRSMPIRLAQARLIPLDSTMSVRFRKSPCRSSNSLEWLFLAHCRNLPLARIAG